MSSEGNAPPTPDGPEAFHHGGNSLSGMGDVGLLRRHSTTGGLVGLQRSAAPNPMDIMESIKGLHELHQIGGLTEEEFTLAKQQILESPSPSTRSRVSGHSSNRGAGGHHHAHRDRHRNRSSDGSSSSTSSSSSSDSSSDSNHFMVIPQARVWQDLDTRSDHSNNSATFHSLAPEPSGTEVIQLLSTALPDPISGPTIVPPEPAVALAGKAVQFTFDTGSLPAGGGPAAAARRPYGTFAPPPGWIGRGSPRDKRAPSEMEREVVLEPEDQVRVHYFNSRGGVGKTFHEVELQPDQLRAPMYLRKNKIVNPPSPTNVQACSPSSPQGSGLPPLSASLAELPSTTESPPHSKRSRGLAQVTSLMELGLEESLRSPALPLPAAAAAAAAAGSVGRTSSRSRSRSHCSSSTASFLEQSLNWNWIDVTGKDPSERHYKKVLRALTRKFNLCESFLVDREHVLTLPQVCESPAHPGQYLLNLRVASQRISLADDSAQLLTNRWIVLIDLHKAVIITIHRIDTRSMAVLRQRWSKVMESSDISFQQFLLKILDDAIYTYQLSLDVHEDLLDKCELKLFSGGSGHFQWESRNAAAAAARRSEISIIDDRILTHFADSSSSPFLRQLLDRTNTSPLPKGETNSFLHHLHRRTAVQLRMLILTQPVLAEAFTKLRLCSKELSAQMTTSCRELSDRALEVRDDAKTLLDLHLSLQSFRTNELMAVLTRLSLFFTPCTFVAGVYGMNFQHFPELSWVYGYAYFWIVCIILVVGMQVYFHLSGLRG